MKRLLALLCFAIALIGLSAWSGSSQNRICAQTEPRRLPLYAAGPKHHIGGPQVGWVEDDVCVKWMNADGTKSSAWPDPVY